MCPQDRTREPRGGVTVGSRHGGLAEEKRGSCEQVEGEPGQVAGRGSMCETH